MPVEQEIRPGVRADLTNEALRLAKLAGDLERRVTSAVDRIAALHARTAVRELEELADLLDDPDTEVRR